MSGETIVAIATAGGSAGVGVLRLSGPNAHAIANALAGRVPAPGHFRYAHFRDASGEVIDDGLLLAFAAPRSFTGEDVIELHAHGSPIVLQVLLQRCVALGARRARPGEFSERAFVNGKLDLVQAEAIADLITAGSEQAARAARRSLDGVFSQRCAQMAQTVLQLRIHVEAAIDFPEEEIDFLADAQLQQGLAEASSELAQLLAEAERGQRLRDGLHVLILGVPNVGKSALLNALAGRDRAIVTAVPGTTRDLLREEVCIDGLALTLVDSAGLRDSADPVEREGMRRARAELEHADVVLWVEDASRIAAEPPPAVPSGTSVIRVHNKADLLAQPPAGDEHELYVSALTGTGLDRLRARLRELAGCGEGSEGAFSARARHVEALQRAQCHLHDAITQLGEHRAGELAAEELRLAHDALGEITGVVHADELLGHIFASFCIGK